MAFTKSESINKVTPTTKNPSLVVIKKTADGTTGLVKKPVTAITTILSTKSSSKSLTPIKPFIKSEKIIKTPIKISKVSASTPQKMTKNPVTSSQTSPSTKPNLKSSEIRNASSNTEPSTSIRSTTKIKSSTEKTLSLLKSSIRKTTLPMKSTSSPLKTSSLKVSLPSKSSSRPTISKLSTSPKSPSRSTLLRDIQPLSTEKTQLPLIKEMKSTTVKSKSTLNKTGANSALNSTLKPIKLPQTIVSKNVSKTGINLKLDISEVEKYNAQNLEKITLKSDKIKLRRGLEPRYLDVSFDDCKSPDPNFDIVQAYKLALKLIRFQEDENLIMNWPQDPTFKFNDEIPSLSNQRETFLLPMCIEPENSDGVLQIMEILKSSRNTKFLKTNPSVSDILVTCDVTKLTNGKSTEITDLIKLVADSTSDSVNAKKIGVESLLSLKFSPNKCEFLCLTYAQESEIENHVEYQTTIQELSQKNISPLQITPVKCQSVCSTSAAVSKKMPEVRVLTNMSNLTPKQPLTPIFNLQMEYQMIKKVENLYTENIFFPKIDTGNNVDRLGTGYDNESDEIEPRLVRKKPYKKFKQFSKRYLKNIRRDFANRHFEDEYDYTNIFIAPVGKNIH